MAKESGRPILIALIAILYFISGVLLIAAGALMLVGGNGIDVSEEDMKALVSLGGVPVIAIGALSLLIAGGFWNGWKIMWYLGVIFEIIGAICMVGMIVTGGIPMIIPLLITLLILYYLFRPKVKQFFDV